jgi:hypothetical protein
MKLTIDSTLILSITLYIQLSMNAESKENVSSYFVDGIKHNFFPKLDKKKVANH